VNLLTWLPFPTGPWTWGCFGGLSSFAWRSETLGFMRQCIMVALVLILTASSSFATGSDSQLWTEIHTTTALNTALDVLVNAQLRFAEDMAEFVQESHQVGINYKVCDYLTISPSYRQIYNQPSDGSSSSQETRAVFLATAHFPIDELHISFGNEFEYRFRYPQTDSWRYRPRITIEHPIGPSPWDLSGYLADEGFYDSDYSTFTRNRAYAGIKKKLMQNLTLDLYYMRQYDINANPGVLNVLGLALRFHFNGAEQGYRPVHSTE